jgi:APA family basic amino acid/polyamine antiporter
VALVISNMIGAGVFLSAGFMAQSMTPGQILLAWVVGGLNALCGARAYASVAQIVPRSGGEYRYLSDLFHPYLGCLAGWCSLLVGFSAPVAVDALSAGSFAQTLGSPVDPRIAGTVLILAMTMIHAHRLESSKWTQNALVVVNGALLVGFVALGLLKGSTEWPRWVPPETHVGFPWAAFMGSLFFVAFAFSGWNAAVYAAEEFEEPSRDVPRAMLIGCALVGVLYLLVNWIFVANLTPERASIVMQYETKRITLGHVIAQDLAGDWGGRLMSVLAIVAFISALSAMTFAGPRLYAAMAGDGFLPRILGARGGRPPVGSVVLQSTLALFLLWTHSVQNVLSNLGAVLTLFAALTAAGLFKARLEDLRPTPSTVSLLCAFVHVGSAAWMLYFGFAGKTNLLVWVGAIVGVATVAYLATPRGGEFPSAVSTSSKE